jgi:hypothetical protein
LVYLIFAVILGRKQTMMFLRDGELVSGIFTTSRTIRRRGTGNGGTTTSYYASFAYETAMDGKRVNVSKEVLVDKETYDHVQSGNNAVQLDGLVLPAYPKSGLPREQLAKSPMEHICLLVMTIGGALGFSYTAVTLWLQAFGEVCNIAGLAVLSVVATLTGTCFLGCVHSRRHDLEDEDPTETGSNVQVTHVVELIMSDAVAETAVASTTQKLKNSNSGEAASSNTSVSSEHSSLIV